MKKIKCVIFDDEHEDAERISFSLLEHWGKIRSRSRHVPELDCTIVADEQLARQILTTAKNDINIFICDILVPDKNGKPQMHGLSLISKAKNFPAVPVVVAMTKGPDVHQSGDFFGKIGQAGADLVFEKSPFQSATGLDLTEHIVQKLETAGQLQYRGKVLKDAGCERSSALESAFERIGESNLSAIANYFCLNSTAQKVLLSSLKPGLSGAHVLLARFSSEEVDLGKKGVLLKISNHPDALKREFDLFEKQVKTQQIFSSRLIVDFLNIAQPFNVNGWHALAGQFEYGASTLVRWLSKSGADPHTVSSVLSDLFLDGGLVETYTSTSKRLEGEAITAIVSKMLTSNRKMRIESAIEELFPLIEKYSPTDLSLVKNIITQGELGDLSRGLIAQRCTWSMQHGDLHASNILIASSGTKERVKFRPKIIDYANISLLPWPLDIVRTLVDIAVSCVDDGVAGYEWESLNRWHVVTEVLTLSDKSLDKEALGVTPSASWIAVCWMCENIFNIAGLEDTALTRAEYLLALAVELMRASYRKEELPPPKRAYGLIAAEAALTASKVQFESAERS